MKVLAVITISRTRGGDASPPSETHTHTDVHRLSSPTAPLPTITEPCSSAQPLRKTHTGCHVSVTNIPKCTHPKCCPFRKGHLRKMHNQSNEWKARHQTFLELFFMQTFPSIPTAYTKFTKFLSWERLRGSPNLTIYLHCSSLR